MGYVLGAVERATKVRDLLSCQKMSHGCQEAHGLQYEIDRFLQGSMGEISALPSRFLA
jgi:hypothetical protein